jgi:hypothetical protein
VVSRELSETIEERQKRFHHQGTKDTKKSKKSEIQLSFLVSLVPWWFNLISSLADLPNFDGAAFWRRL